MGASVTVIVFSVIFVCVLCIIIFSLGLLAVLKTSGSCPPSPKTIAPATKTCNVNEITPKQILSTSKTSDFAKTEASVNLNLASSQENVGKFTLPTASFSMEKRNTPLGMGTIEYVPSRSLSDQVKEIQDHSISSPKSGSASSRNKSESKFKYDESKTNIYSDDRSPVGSYNGPIDVQSSEYDSDSEDEVEVSSPIVQRYSGPQFFTMGTSCKYVLDAVTFSSWNLWLEASNTIRVQDGSKNKKVTLNESIKQLCSFADNLYGLSNSGLLYKIDPGKTNEWKCTKVSWAPENIIFISSTYDDENMWLQSNNTGYLFESSFRLLEEVTIKGKYRIYGMDKNNYAVYDYVNKVSSYEDSRISNTKYCLLDSHNRLYVIRDDKHSKIVLVQWNPIYVEK